MVSTPRPSFGGSRPPPLRVMCQRSRHGDIAGTQTVRRARQLSTPNCTAAPRPAAGPHRRPGSPALYGPAIGAGAVPHVAQTLPRCLVGRRRCPFPAWDIPPPPGRRTASPHGVGQFGSRHSPSTHQKQCPDQNRTFHSEVTPTGPETARNGGRGHHDVAATAAGGLQHGSEEAPSIIRHFWSLSLSGRFRAMQTVFRQRLKQLLRQLTSRPRPLPRNPGADPAAPAAGRPPRRRQPGQAAAPALTAAAAAPPAGPPAGTAPPIAVRTGIHASQGGGVFYQVERVTDLLHQHHQHHYQAARVVIMACSSRPLRASTKFSTATRIPMALF